MVMSNLLMDVMQIVNFSAVTGQLKEVKNVMMGIGLMEMNAMLFVS